MSSIDSKILPREPTDSSVKFRENFNYLLKNIERIRASKRLKVIKLDFDSNNSNIGSNTGHKSCLDLDETIAEELNINEMDLKERGEKDITKSISHQKFDQIMESLKNVKTFKDISFEQIVCLIKSFEQTLREISCDQNNQSFFGKVYRKSGFPGIIGTIDLSLYSKRQKYYIMGCLYGLFTNDQKAGKQLFGVLYPETLVRIAMAFKDVDYETALDLLKPKN